MSTTARKARKQIARTAREHLALVIASGASKRTVAYKKAVEAVNLTRYVSTRGTRTRNSTRRLRRDYFDFPLEASRNLPPVIPAGFDAATAALASSAHSKPTNVQRAARGK